MIKDAEGFERSLTPHLCPECGAQMWYDGTKDWFVCSLSMCGKKWKRDFILNKKFDKKNMWDKQLMKLHTKGGKKVANKVKAVCEGCGRESNIIGKGCCGSCYALLRKKGFTITELHDWRQEHPVGTRIKKEKKPREHKHAQPSVPEARFAGEQVIPVRVKLALDIIVSVKKVDLQ